MHWFCERANCREEFQESLEWYNRQKGEHGAVYCPEHRGELVSEFEEEFAKRFPTLDLGFIELMNEIGKLGRDKYGDQAVESRAKRGVVSRAGMPRIYAREIAKHAANHFEEYLDGIKHDVYETKKHQLAAAAFNPMMEYLLAELKEEK